MRTFPFALSCLAAAAALALPVVAQAQLSFNLGVVSLYKYNGLDQDSRQLERERDLRPALQGGVDYDFGNGFYIGNWNSTGRFGEANLEINLYGGYSGEFANGLGFDVGYIKYLYPSQGSWNGSEVYGSLSYGVLTTKLSWGTSGAIDEHARLSFLIEQPLTERLTLEAGVGFRNTSNFNSGATDYRLGLTYALTEGLSTSAIWSGADTNRAGPAGTGRLVLGLTQSF